MRPIEAFYDAWWQASCANGRLFWASAASTVDASQQWLALWNPSRAQSAVREIHESFFGEHQVLYLDDLRKKG